MHRSAVARTFCSSITWSENNRECLLIKAASLMLWLASTRWMIVLLKSL